MEIPGIIKLGVVVFVIIVLFSIIGNSFGNNDGMKAFTFVMLWVFAGIYVLIKLPRPQKVTVANPIITQSYSKVNFKTYPELHDLGAYFEYAHSEAEKHNLSGDKLQKFEHDMFAAYINSLPESFSLYTDNWQKKRYLASFKQILSSDQRAQTEKIDIPVMSDAEGHLVTIAASRSGKGACQIIPNLLLPFDNSYIVLDIKGENAAVTAKYQASIGHEVHIIDPFNEQKRIGAAHGIGASGFNPLHSLDIDSDDFYDDVTSIVEAITPLGNEKEPFWIKRARALLRGLIMHHVTSEPKENWTLSYIYNVLRFERVKLMAFIAMGADNEHSTADLAQFKGIDPSENKTFGSVLDTALASTEFMRIYLKTDKLIKTFDPNLITQKPTAIYIVIPQDKLENYFIWLRLMVSLTLNAARKNMTERRVVFMLDEFPQLGKMENISKGIGLLAGFNISLWIFAQNIMQLKEVYGDTWETLLDVKVKMFYKITEKSTLEYISKMLGYEEKQKTSFNSSNSSSQTFGEKGSNTSGNSYATTKSESTELIMHPNEVGFLLEDVCLTFIGAKNFDLEMIPYFKLNDTKNNAQKNPLII